MRSGVEGSVSLVWLLSSESEYIPKSVEEVRAIVDPERLGAPFSVGESVPGGE